MPKLEDNSYRDFIKRFKVLVSKHPKLVLTMLSNIFTMRLIGNKTHGDLAEIAVAEFINQYMYDFSSVHVGKDLFRSKNQEEDIKVINEISKKEFCISIKAYGDGPLQLSTDKNHLLFPRLQKEGNVINDKNSINEIFVDPAFFNVLKMNVFPLIYNEKEKRCNILIFDYARAMSETIKIILEEESKIRKHPVYKFYDKGGQYICEVRYGGRTSNALQRGLWTHTKRGLNYFDSVTCGWIDYSHNNLLIKLFSHALIATEYGHKQAFEKIKENIFFLKKSSGN